MTDTVEEQFVVPEQEGVGARLKRERENQGLSVFDVARALRLSEKQIAALESDDYSKLPGRTFVRGFVRNYARLVQLEPETVMSRLFFAEEDPSRQIQAPSQKISFSEHRGRPWLKWLVMTFVFVSVFSWGVLEWIGPEQPKTDMASRTPGQHAQAPRPDTAAQGAASSAPSSEEKPPSSAASDATALPPAVLPTSSATEALAIQAGTPQPVIALAKLTLTFSGRAWVEVKDKHGKIIHSQNNTAGTEQLVEGEAPLSLVIGSSPNVKLIYKGQPVDLSSYAKADVARLTLE